MNLPLLLAIISFFLVLIALIIAKVAEDYIKNKAKRVKKNEYKLDRHDHNPILSPQMTREWEHGGTFNPAAIKDDTGKIHLFYRAVGADGISRIGHSSSQDGTTFDSDDRSMYPVFEPLPGYGMPDPARTTGPKKYCPEYYTSGGGWGGAEDPRAVLIGKRVYVTYVAFEGWSSVRIGLTSIALEDLKKKKWNWRRPVLISKPEERCKNWLIFPEKINGRYAIIHSIVPKILIEYVDSLDTISKPISSPRPMGVQPGRKGFWDNWMRGAGAPPIKTDIGWLLLYHAIDKDDPNRYKVGAMILDTKDPTKILYRSPQPILEPDAHYENDGKPGVVYASGAVVIGDNLMVYYGGGDKHVCIAQTPMKTLLEWLVRYGKVSN